MALVVLVLALTAACCSARRPSAIELQRGYTFEQYSSDFRKTYRTADEHQQRKAHFSRNLARVLRHNQHNSARYRMGVNVMSDWSPEEQHDLLAASSLVRPAPGSRHPIAIADEVEGEEMEAPLPTAVDWRRRVPSLLTPVKAQGRAPAGWSAAAVEQLETYLALSSGELYTLSMQEVLSCAPPPNSPPSAAAGCRRGTIEDAYAYMKESGVAQEWEAPYSSYGGQCPMCVNSSRPVAFPASFSSLKPNSQSSVMRHLATQGPLAVSVDASSWLFYESGIFDGCPTSLNVTLNHVAQLVGYGRDGAWDAEYWVVRNSWSPEFGEGGYLRLYKASEEADEGCSWDNSNNSSQPPVRVCGTCGVLYNPTYPIVPRQ